MILGLTGPYCSGKSTAAGILQKQGFSIINVDKLGHKALEATLNEVSVLLGPQIINMDGSANRKAIGTLVFADPILLSHYEAIIHPVMNRLLEENINSLQSSNTVIDAAILYRLPAVSHCKLILQIQAPLLLRLYRSKKRDGSSFRKAYQRIQGQKYLWKMADQYKDSVKIIHNWSGTVKLEKELYNAISNLN